VRTAGRADGTALAARPGVADDAALTTRSGDDDDALAAPSGDAGGDTPSLRGQVEPMTTPPSADGQVKLRV
jgi:hypothetical protein